MTEVPPAPPPSRKKLLYGLTGAVAVAAVALVVFILPAEYGIDPTGAGEALGIAKLSEGAEENIYLRRGLARTNVLYPIDAGPELSRFGVREMFAAKDVAFPADAELNSDRFQFELLPYEGIELKYELTRGAPMAFSWHAAAPVNFDMHAHPYQGGEEMTESFVITDARSQTAVYVAPFTGIHGWYWQNRTLENVKLTLDATGAFTASKTFDAAGEHDRPLSPPAVGDPAETAPSDG